MTLAAPRKLRPTAVSEYSTWGGMVGNTVRSTMPWRSSARSVCVSIFWLIGAVRRRSSEKRIAPRSENRR